MALCSSAFSVSNKRSCDAGGAGPTPKRSCLSKIDLNLSGSAPRVSSLFSNTEHRPQCFSSSDSENDSDDQQSCYRANQIRAKRRASNRVSFSLSNELSKAVSQYSDDDDEIKDQHDAASTIGADASDNLDCLLSRSPSSVGILSTTGLTVHARSSSTCSFLQISDSSCLPATKRANVPDIEKKARSRCFDYLVGAIDEAWARYCDAASFVEEETYGYNTPCSVATDDEEFGEQTDLTDYESEFEHTGKTFHQRKPSMLGLRSCWNKNNENRSNSELCTSSNDASSFHLLELKDRLIKAKYFLQDLVSSDDYNDAVAFWKRWDMIKYATIELVEDDDDDEIIEVTIDALEEGRLVLN